MKKIRKFITRRVDNSTVRQRVAPSALPLNANQQSNNRLGKMDDASSDSFWYSSAISQHKFTFDDDDQQLHPLANLTIGAAEDSILQKVELDGQSSGQLQTRSARRFGQSSTPSSTSSSTSSWSSLGIAGVTGTSSNTSTGNSMFYAADRIGQFNDQSQPKTPISATDAAKLESEVIFLRKALDVQAEATKNRWSPLPAQQIVRRIISGKPYCVEDCKSKEHKLQLLDYALASHDGNAITAAVLGARNTLKRTLFYQELMSRPEALDHYLIYLRNEQDYAELSDILAMVDRNEEAALLNYRLALRSRLVRTRLDALRHCLANHFQVTADNDNRQYVDEHLRILEMQRPIDDIDAKLHLAGTDNQISSKPEVRKSLINASLISTLFYCCLNHYNASENELLSPQALRRRYQLTDKQFVWTAFIARAQCKSWQDLDNLLVTKSWLASSKKIVIDPAKILEILQKHSADVGLLSKFARMIENVDERLEVATKFKCHEVAVDAFVQTRDRQGLRNYGKHILTHTKEHLYWRDAVQSNTTKWKN